MNRLLFLCATLFFWASACENDPTASIASPVAEIIGEVGNDFAPDKRVAIWDVQSAYSGSNLVLKGQTNLPEAKASLTKKLDTLKQIWVDSIVLLPNKEKLGERNYGIVTLSACNIRSQARHSAELATQSTLGTILKIWDQSGDWYRVQTPDGYLGWLDAGGFALKTEKEIREYQQSNRVIYTANSGFSYASPDLNSQKVSDLLAGNLLISTGTEGPFTKVQYPDGRSAYLLSKELKAWDDWLATRAAKPEKIIATAREMLGRPYLWGGTSGKAFDCSGFTKTVLYLNGLILPRDASQQIHVGKPLDIDDISELQVGDFLFFGRAASKEQKEKITHVAIYLGSNRIIHAAGRVKIESLNPEDPDFAAERLATFVRATRPLDQPENHNIPSLAQSDWY